MKLRVLLEYLGFFALILLAYWGIWILWGRFIRYHAGC